MKINKDTVFLGIVCIIAPTIALCFHVVPIHTKGYVFLGIEIGIGITLLTQAIQKLTSKKE